MDASLEDLRGRQRFRQACHSKEQAYRVDLIATRYRATFCGSSREADTAKVPSAFVEGLTNAVC